MNKFKYRLIEQEGGEEESGLKQLRGKNELILTALGDNNADKLINIIQNPENLKGTFVLKSDELANFEKKVFGDPLASDSKNIEMYQENGLELYKKIAKEVGGFKKGTPFSKTKAGKIEYWFPEKNKYNIDLARKYFQEDEGKKTIRTSLKPIKIDDISLKFQIGDEEILKTILKNAKLVSGEDYTLKIQKSLD